MAYVFKRRRKGNFKRRGNSANKSAKGIAKRAARGVKKLNKLIETKHVDNYFTGQLTTIAAATVPINATVLTSIDGGTGQYNRVGVKVSIKNLLLRYSVQAATTSSTPYVNTMRVLVIWQKVWNQGTTVPPIEFFLTTSGNPTSDIISPNRWSNRTQFKVLYDKIYHQVDRAANSTHVGKTVKIPIRREVLYNANSVSGNASVENGALWLYLLSDHGAVTTPPYFDVYTRLTFQDM